MKPLGKKPVTSVKVSNKFEAIEDKVEIEEEDDKRGVKRKHTNVSISSKKFNLITKLVDFSF
jgi:hypothetical protein